ncbi:MAG: Serine/threonine protein kinase [Gemmatimonadetes bacterium]|nr:Serine/threonine protein kinase [Gemmatimonadota bacterium]
MSGLEALLTGRVMADRYRIEEVIGRGGMGAVYRAVDERLDRPVAVKVITIAGGLDAAGREKLRARFRHEASAAARLPHHPNVVPVYDYGTDPTLGLDFLVMELLRGEDLATLLARSGPPPVATGLRILLGAARGVAVGHRARLIHRDVKPGNVFLARTGEGDETTVRVLDFGIAKLMADEDTGTQLTHDGRAPLSPAYASPEQLRGEERLTPASDVFSLGALGFQLLTGDRPFTDNDRNRMAVGMAVPIPSIRARNPGVPEAAEQVIHRALADDAAARFPDAGVLADAVQRVLSGEPVTVPPFVPSPASVHADDDDRTLLAPPDRPPYTAAAAAEIPPRAIAPAPAIQPPRRRQREDVEAEGSGVGKVLLWVLLAAVVLGIAGFVVFQSMTGRRSAQPIAAAPVDSAAVVDSAAAAAQMQDDTDALAADLEGRRLLRAGDYPGALAQFERAMQISPARADYRDHYAYGLLMLRRPQEAAQQLEEAIRLDPRADRPLSHLADARLMLGDTAGAIASLQRFLALSTDAAARQEVQRKLDALTAPPAVIPTQPGADTAAKPAPDTSAAPDTTRPPPVSPRER